MSMIIRATKKEDDGLQRTDWFPASTQPTIPGEYEAQTGGGHVFRRKWTSHGWINSVTGLVSKAELEWRGIKPGSVEIGRYPQTLHDNLRLGLAMLYEASTPPEHRRGPSLIEKHAAIGLPFA